MEQWKHVTTLLEERVKQFLNIDELQESIETMHSNVEENENHNRNWSDLRKRNTKELKLRIGDFRGDYKANQGEKIYLICVFDPNEFPV